MTVMTRGVARILYLPLYMVAAAVLIKGYADIGDGFSAGVIVSLGIIIQGVAFGADEFDRMPFVRFAPLGTIVGLFLALAVGFGPVLFGNPIFLHYPRAGDHARHFGSLEFITPVVFDIGVFLVVIGFCVGTLSAVARETVRRERESQPPDRAAAVREGVSR
jgi:multisubunit Na+/H+ antiporter MnhB subunit